MLFRTFSAPILLTMFSLAISSKTFAQDSIFMRKGPVVTGKVLRIGRKQVHFEVPVAEGTKHRSRYVHHVARIVFADGGSWPEPRELRREKQAKIVAARRRRLDETRNFIYFTAPALQVIGQSRGPAAGLGYERILTPGGNLSASVNGLAFITRDRGFYKTEPIGPYTDMTGFYAAPGLQFHPFGHRRRGDLSLGIDIPLGVINCTDGLFDGNVQTGTANRQDLIFAAEGTAALRIHSSRGSTIMFNAAGGPLILSNASYGGTFRIGFCFGLRY
jgi:hypothetical protein